MHWQISSICRIYNPELSSSPAGNYGSGFLACRKMRLSRSRRQSTTFLVFYSFATWIYRFFLFLGIALLVYFFAFKILGIFFAVEIIWFIGRPVYAEMKRWWSRRTMFSMNRQTRRTTLTFLALLIVAFAPWRTTVSAPAVLESALKAPIHLPHAARVSALHVKKGQFVRKNDLLCLRSAPR